MVWGLQELLGSLPVPLQPCQVRWGHWSSINQLKRQIISEKQKKKAYSVGTPGWMTRTSTGPLSLHGPPVRRRPQVWRAKSSPARCSPVWAPVSPTRSCDRLSELCKVSFQEPSSFLAGNGPQLSSPASHPWGRSDFLRTIVSTVKEPKRGASISPYLSHKDTKAKTYKMSKKVISLPLLDTWGHIIERTAI